MAIGKTASAEAGALISYRTSVETEIELTVEHLYADRRPEGNIFYGQGWEIYDTEYDVGSLIPNGMDADSQKIVWRGWAHAQMDFSSSQKKMEKRVKQAVRLVFKCFLR